DHMALITAVLVGWFGLIAIIDHRHGVVPDRLVRPALWVGLILAACGQAILTPAAAILGAAGAWTGITALRGFAARYLPNRRPPQLGDGDVKLAAALGAWLGLWPALAAFAIAAALLAIFAAVRGTSRTQAFAPAFCLTALCLFVLQPFSSFDLGTRL
ncbi:MAG TPA: prepilin peptidase, partial [Rhodospirillaceae bacterium]|nr:prepilin peptidase [Rhodospirillaceae bacterium]